MATGTTIIKEDSIDNANTYRTPLAKWARILEIIIPAYMLGKSWGIAQPDNIELFKAQFPTFIVNITEAMKSIFTVNSVELQRLISTTSGALMGFACILLLSVITHHILRDRKFIDSLRFTAITMLPIAVLNGTLSHGLQSLLDNSALKTVNALKAEAIFTPWSYFLLNFAFYMTALWVMGRRTGVENKKRLLLSGLGVAVMVIYLLAGFMIMPNEWNELAASLIKK